MASKRKPPDDATPFLPQRLTLPALREAAKSCRGCGLYLSATQTVFGEGPSSARVVFIGEQPGDAEDRQGRPFVGPAGRLLDQALQRAGLSREGVYITNAVKHFSFEPRGKARLHKRPRAGEVRACSPWLRAELAAVGAEVLVLLGATAAQAVFGPAFRIGKDRGVLQRDEHGRAVLATYHPSAVLRARDDSEREHLFELLVGDLRLVSELLRTRS